MRYPGYLGYIIKFPGSSPSYPHTILTFEPGGVSRRDGAFRLATGGLETKGPGSDGAIHGNPNVDGFWRLIFSGTQLTMEHDHSKK